MYYYARLSQPRVCPSRGIPSRPNLPRGYLSTVSKPADPTESLSIAQHLSTSHSPLVQGSGYGYIYISGWRVGFRRRAQRLRQYSRSRCDHRWFRRDKPRASRRSLTVLLPKPGYHIQRASSFTSNKHQVQRIKPPHQIDSPSLCEPDLSSTSKPFTLS